MVNKHLAKSVVHVTIPWYVTILTKFGDHKHCVSGDMMFLICHVTLLGHMFKGLCEFMGGGTLR